MTVPAQSQEEIAQDRNAKPNATSEMQQPFDQTKVEGEQAVGIHAMDTLFGSTSYDRFRRELRLTTGSGFLDGEILGGIT